MCPSALRIRILRIMIVVPVYLLAQGNPSPADSTLQMTPPSDEEIILDEIEIKGRVDKPGVIILPKRIEPEVQELDLDRSFQQEVKNGIGEIPGPDRMLRELEQVESIKKAVEKNRNKS